LEEEENKFKYGNNFKIILASGSPRRNRILRMLDLEFVTMEPQGAIEKQFGDPVRTTLYNSGIKAQFVYNHVIISNLNCENTVVAGFDTVIQIEGRQIGKPENIEDARDFLKLLSGRTHRVITGTTIIDCFSKKTVCGTEKTEVLFKKLSSREIENYLKKETVTDKAGAYDISGTGCVFVEKINGCFYNVAGLPVFKFSELLTELGYFLI
jgi:septum formation protein